MLAATTCGTDVKMWRSGHPILGDYPAPFGHETAGVGGPAHKWVVLP